MTILPWCIYFRHFVVVGNDHFLTVTILLFTIQNHDFIEKLQKQAKFLKEVQKLNLNKLLSSKIVLNSKFKNSSQQSIVNRNAPPLFSSTKRLWKLINCFNPKMLYPFCFITLINCFSLIEQTIKIEGKTIYQIFYIRNWELSWAEKIYNNLWSENFNLLF